MVALPFRLQQWGLGRVCPLACLLGLFAFAGDALTVLRPFLKQVERIHCEAEFLLWNRQGLARLHTRLLVEITKLAKR